jgi:hypothetical protein
MSMFKGVSQCYPAVNMLYFGHFNPLYHLPLPLPFQLSFIQQCSVHIFISSIYAELLAVVLFSFPSSPKFNSVTQLLKNVLHVDGM